MTKVIFSRKEFEKEIKITKEIEEKINLFGTPIDSLTSEEIEIEISPNRPDLLSLYNYLRAFKAFIGKEKGLKKYKINKPEKNYKIIVDKSVKEIRPCTVCAIVKSLLLTEEKIKDIINMQEKLAFTVGRNRKKMAIGIYPLNKINLPIRYTAKEPKEIKYQPLGAQQELTASEILLLHPTGRKYAHLLDNTKKYPIFIDANNQVLSMPPIINSEQTGRIDVNTKE
ncbi:MAG: phenylalanine--tRNA ligase subunit beta, partial [Nanoarchaeota archaeon]